MDSTPHPLPEPPDIRLRFASDIQGRAVSLSDDGNTALVGAPTDNNFSGAAWIWTRSGGAWTQQGPKLVGSGAAGAAGQGECVSLSGDGNTAILGGYSDHNSIGAAWIWTRSGGTWTQQGPKFVGSGASGPEDQGRSVALSDDGNTAIVGGFGGAWVWTRSGGIWTQQGSILAGSGAIGDADRGPLWPSRPMAAPRSSAVAPTTEVLARCGSGLALAASGASKPSSSVRERSVLHSRAVPWPYPQMEALAITGGPEDNNRIGAAWVFVTAAVANPATIPAVSFRTLLALAILLSLLGILRIRA